MFDYNTNVWKRVSPADEMQKTDEKAIKSVSSVYAEMNHNFNMNIRPIFLVPNYRTSLNELKEKNPLILIRSEGIGNTMGKAAINRIARKKKDTYAGELLYSCKFLDLLNSMQGFNYKISMQILVDVIVVENGKVINIIPPGNARLGNLFFVEQISSYAADEIKGIAYHEFMHNLGSFDETSTERMAIAYSLTNNTYDIPAALINARRKEAASLKGMRDDVSGSTNFINSDALTEFIDWRLKTLKDYQEAYELDEEATANAVKHIKSMLLH